MPKKTDQSYASYAFATCLPSASVELSEMAMERERESESYIYIFSFFSPSLSVCFFLFSVLSGRCKINLGDGSEVTRHSKSWMTTRLNDSLRCARKKSGTWKISRTLVKSLKSFAKSVNTCDILWDCCEFSFTQGFLRWAFGSQVAYFSLSNLTITKAKQRNKHALFWQFLIPRFVVGEGGLVQLPWILVSDKSRVPGPSALRRIFEVLDEDGSGLVTTEVRLSGCSNAGTGIIRAGIWCWAPNRTLGRPKLDTFWTRQSLLAKAGHQGTWQSGIAWHSLEGSVERIWEKRQAIHYLIVCAVGWKYHQSFKLTGGYRRRFEDGECGSMRIFHSSRWPRAQKNTIYII